MYFKSGLTDKGKDLTSIWDSSLYSLQAPVDAFQIDCQGFQANTNVPIVRRLGGLFCNDLNIILTADSSCRRRKCVGDSWTGANLTQAFSSSSFFPQTLQYVRWLQRFSGFSIRQKSLKRTAILPKFCLKQFSSREWMLYIIHPEIAYAYSSSKRLQFSWTNMPEGQARSSNTNGARSPISNRPVQS